MGPWLADTIRQCDGLTEMMSYWTFSDVFEEQGVVKTPFYGGFGVIAEDDIPKPAFNVFKILHLLGDERIRLDSNSVLFTRRKDGTLVLAVWNYAPPEHAGATRTFQLRFENAKAREARISRVDSDHGDVHSAYAKMGSPQFPTQQQLQELQLAGHLPGPEIARVKHGELSLTLPSYGLAVVEIK